MERRDDPVPDNVEEEIEQEITAWTAECPHCGEPRLTMLTKAAEAGPWVEIVGGATDVDEEDYYCRECGGFVNLKEAGIWVEAMEID
ncbi:hypothetical protein BRD56_13090 [Thermoplasmatales archaeon SW_10_69_26]|nr:MAG: hypothetical protein BRD56_13090 [Thermoplasmatales archaeon SW_10_69_26]